MQSFCLEETAIPTSCKDGVRRFFIYSSYWLNTKLQEALTNFTHTLYLCEPRYCLYEGKTYVTAEALLHLRLPLLMLWTFGSSHYASGQKLISSSKSRQTFQKEINAQKLQDEHQLQRASRSAHTKQISSGWCSRNNAACRPCLRKGMKTVYLCSTADCQ